MLTLAIFKPLRSCLGEYLASNGLDLRLSVTNDISIGNRSTMPPKNVTNFDVKEKISIFVARLKFKDRPHKPPKQKKTTQKQQTQKHTTKTQTKQQNNMKLF